MPSVLTHVFTPEVHLCGKFERGADHANDPVQSVLYNVPRHTRSLFAENVYKYTTRVVIKIIIQRRGMRWSVRNRVPEIARLDSLALRRLLVLFQWISKAIPYFVSAGIRGNS